MSDLPTILGELVAFSRHLRATPDAITRADLNRLEYFHQMLTYHVTYGDREATEAILSENARYPKRELAARRCSIEGCHGGPVLWNVAAGKLNGAVDWRCLAHIPVDMTYPVSLSGDEWKATGRK